MAVDAALVGRFVDETTGINDGDGVDRRKLLVMRPKLIGRGLATTLAGFWQSNGGGVVRIDG